MEGHTCPPPLWRTIGHTGLGLDLRACLPVFWPFPSLWQDWLGSTSIEREFARHRRGSIEIASLAPSRLPLSITVPLQQLRPPCLRDASSLIRPDSGNAASAY
jgi:hypothetical protein